MINICVCPLIPKYKRQPSYSKTAICKLRNQKSTLINTFIITYVRTYLDFKCHINKSPGNI